MTEVVGKYVTISARKLAANRTNAVKSTGPRTQSGKSISRNNARRHGLAARPQTVPENTRKMRTLARMICGERAKASEFDEALSIAQCQMILQNVQAARVAIMRGAKAAESSFPENFGPAHFAWHDAGQSGAKARGVGNSHAGADEEVEAMRLTLPQALKLSQYEKRAYSRRWRAIRTFTSLRIRNRPTTSNS